MKKKTYISPMAFCVQMHCPAILEGSTEELIFDPDDETFESLTKEQHDYNVWDNEW